MRKKIGSSKKVGNCEIWGKRVRAYNNNILEPIRIPHRTPKSRIHEPRSITSETGTMREPSSHFTERAHDDVDE